MLRRGLACSHVRQVVDSSAGSRRQQVVDSSAGGRGDISRQGCRVSNIVMTRPGFSLYRGKVPIQFPSTWHCSGNVAERCWLIEIN